MKFKSEINLFDIIAQKRELQTTEYLSLVEALQSALQVNVDSSKYHPNSVVKGGTYNPRDPAPSVAEVEFDNDLSQLTLEDAIDKVAHMVQEDKAMNDAILNHIITVYSILLKWGDAYTVNKLFNLNEVKNRQFQTMAYGLMYRDTTGNSLGKNVPASLVYPVLFYLITGRTNYVRTFREFNFVALGQPKLSHKSFLLFLNINVFPLAEEFRRNRSLLMFMKNKYNFTEPMTEADYQEKRSLINKISKLSRTFNVKHTTPDNTNINYEKKPTKELSRMLYAGDTITVRNGRQYVLEGRTNPYDTNRIRKILATRDDVFTQEQLELESRNWDLAIPAGAKQGLGIIPNYSSFPIHEGENVGFIWRTEDKAHPWIDFDLSAFLFDFSDKHPIAKIGWNGMDNIVTSSADIHYSGDMTHVVPNDKTGRYEASEFITINNLAEDKALGIEISTYGADFENENVTLEAVVGDELIPMEAPQNTTTLGIIYQGRFWVVASHTGVTNVSSATLFEKALHSLDNFLENKVANN